MKTGIIQQHNTSDIEDNRRRLADKIRRLAAEGARLVVCQELHDSLYFCQTENVDLCGLAVPVPGDVTDFYSAIARESGVVLVTSLYEKRAPGLYHNTAVVFEADGSIAGKYRKMHIPDDPAYYEKFYFTPGDLGFTPINTSVGRLGVLVCWDQWYPEAARLMALAGARPCHCQRPSRSVGEPCRLRTRPVGSHRRHHILGLEFRCRSARRIPFQGIGQRRS